MALFLYFLLLLSLTHHSSALYCLCKDGVSDQALQKAIDYACGNGADCSAILQNGACYQPNTVKDHCNYAVNSYYQRKGNAQDSCDFSGAASTSPNPPSTSSGCVYPSSPSNAGSGSTTPSTGTPGTSPSTTPSGNGTGTGTGTGFGTGSPTGVFGMSPSSSTGVNDGSGAALSPLQGTQTMFPITLLLTLLLVLRL
ncbi:hypothetical protein PIB30_011011 [Stylosanthes scabra]|uniref:X8 domain-containing protein n=1 Tax=Stylosanthes scabra TaxID=79078 RepID=A0ABU6W541_9FABA|nr:hypothetical protein [Stylosanthes scabra]